MNWEWSRKAVERDRDTRAPRAAQKAGGEFRERLYPSGPAIRALAATPGAVKGPGDKRNLNG